MSIFDFSDYIADRTRDFTGREWVFAEIDRWLADDKGPSFFIITGEPGIGKSAIASRLTQIRDLAAIHFCIARQADTIDPLNFARSLSHQLTRIDGFAQDILEEQGIHLEVHINIRENYGQAIGVQIENLVGEARSASIAFNRIVGDPLRRLYADGFEEQLVILVDALDEAVQQPGGETIVDLLAGARGLPPQVRFVLTSRPEGAALRHFEQLHIPHLLLDAGREENLQDVRAYIGRRLEASEALGARLAEQEMERRAFVKRITEASGGNFLYLVWLLPAVAKGTQRFDALEALPQGLDGIYRDFLRVRKTRDEGEWRRCYRLLLGVLAAAQTPLTIDQLAQFTGLGRQEVDDGLRDVGQFLDPTSAGQDRYQLYHQSVVDWLRSRERAKEFWIDLAQVHERIVMHYRSKGRTWDGVNWKQVDDYGLLYLAHHLYALREQDAFRSQLHELICQPFMAVKRERTGSHRAFAADVALAIVAAAAETSRDAMVHLVRDVFVYVTLSSLATQVPPELLGVLVQLGQLERAEEYAELIQDGTRRSEAYGAICGTLSEVVQALAQAGQQDRAAAAADQALAAAERIPDEGVNAEVLSEVARALLRVGNAHGLNLATPLKTADTRARAQASMLSEVVKALFRRDERSKALQAAGQAARAAQAVESKTAKVFALGQVAVALWQVDHRNEAATLLDEAEQIGDSFVRPHERAAAFSQVARVYAKVGQRDQAIVLARRAHDEAQLVKRKRAKALALASAAWGLAEAGQHREAGDVAAQTQALLEDVIDALGRVRGLNMVVHALAEADEWNAARWAAEQSLAVAAGIDQLEKRVEAQTITAQAWARLNHYEEAWQVVRAAFVATYPVGRGAVLNTLAKMADVLAAPDQGQTLWRVYQAIREVEGWWGVG